MLKRLIRKWLGIFELYNNDAKLENRINKITEFMINTEKKRSDDFKYLNTRITLLNQKLEEKNHA